MQKSGVFLFGFIVGRIVGQPFYNKVKAFETQLFANPYINPYISTLLAFLFSANFAPEPKARQSVTPHKGTATSNAVRSLAEATPINNKIMETTLQQLFDALAERVADIVISYLKDEEARKQETAKDNSTVSQDEALALLGIKDVTLWRWRKDGYIKSVKVGKAVRIPRSEIKRILNGESRKPTDEWVNANTPTFENIRRQHTTTKKGGTQC